MNRNIIKSMCCPFCGSDLDIEQIFEENLDEILTGYLKCECGKFPIVEGILILKKGFLIEFVADQLYKGNTKFAIKILLSKYADFISYLTPSIKEKHIINLAFKGVSESSDKTYDRYIKRYPFFNLLGNSSSEVYLKHRFSTESFWSIYPFIPLLSQKKRILDICCGMGHASFVISKYTKTDDHICIDQSFKNLVFARNYFINNANFICMDLNFPIPFKSHTFDAIFMLDAYHYISAVSLLAKEIERVLMQTGLLLILHLHNALVENYFEGRPLSPSGWVNLFKRIPIRVFPEKNIITDFLKEHSLYLDKKYSNSELNIANAICLIGTNDNLIFTRYNNHFNFLFNGMNNLIFNPIYDLVPSSNGVFLYRKFPNGLLKLEYPLMDKYLIDELFIKKDIFDIVKNKNLVYNSSMQTLPLIKEIQNLMSRFVIINVPENYY